MNTLSPKEFVRRVCFEQVSIGLTFYKLYDRQYQYEKSSFHNCGL